jgi:hypothetical protein
MLTTRVRRSLRVYLEGSPGPLTVLSFLQQVAELETVMYPLLWSETPGDL